MLVLRILKLKLQDIASGGNGSGLSGGAAGATGGPLGANRTHTSPLRRSLLGGPELAAHSGAGSGRGAVASPISVFSRPPAYVYDSEPNVVLHMGTAAGK